MRDERRRPFQNHHTPPGARIVLASQIVADQRSTCAQTPEGGRMEKRALQFQDWIARAHLIDRPELYVGLPESVQKLTDWAAGV